MSRRASMTIGVAVSWSSMLVHNLYELPISVFALENTGPLLAALVLLGAYLLAPASRFPATALFAWGWLNLVVGGILTVLPLPFLPFAPEQSVGHYAAHLVYSLGQLPLIAFSWAALRRPEPPGPAS